MGIFNKKQPNVSQVVSTDAQPVAYEKTNAWARLFSNNVRWLQSVGMAMFFGMLSMGQAQAGNVRLSAPDTVGFGDLAGKAWSAVCSFTSSPIVGVFVGVTLVGMFLIMTMGEDKGAKSAIAKTVVMALAVTYIPKIVGLLGFTVNGAGC